MYRITNLTDTLLCVGSLQFAPFQARDIPDVVWAKSSAPTLRKANDLESQQKLSIVYTALTNAVEDGQSSLIPGIASPFGQQLILAADKPAAKALLEVGEGGPGGGVSPGSFRVSNVGSTQSGLYGIQSGVDNTQSGNYNTQSGYYSTQSGNYNSQKGSNNSQTAGNHNTQSGYGNTQSGSYNTQSGSYNTQSGNYNTQSGNYNTQTGNEGFQHGDGLNDGGFDHTFMFGNTKTATVGDRAYFATPNGIWITPLAGDAADPENGVIGYNETTHKFRGYANGAWVDLH